MGALSTVGQPQAPPPDQRNSSVETSASTPATGTIEQRKEKFFGTPDYKKLESNLIQCWKLHVDDWATPRRLWLRETLRAIEYDKGNQYIAWDPFTCAYFNPFTQSGPSGQGGTEQSGQNEANLYQCSTNIINWLRRVWTSTLGASVPDVEWWPGDSKSDLDNRAAVARGRAYRKIASDNHDKDQLEQALDYLFLTGSYFRHQRWSMDQDITGTHREPVMGWQKKTVAPDRYTCPDCGTDNPANMQNVSLGGTQCMNCGKPLNSAHFFPAAELNMPVVTGWRDVPNGQVRWDFYNGMNVEVMPQANTNGGGVIANTPLLDLSLDITKGAFRRMYPGAWDLAKESATDSATPDSEFARLARWRVATPGLARGTWQAQHTPTLHKVYFTPDAVMALDKQGEAQQLADIVKDGCVAAILNEKIIDIQPTVMRKEWSWCGAKKGVGAYPPAPVRTALDFQDRINDRMNGVDEYHDRAGCPPILFNQTILGEAMNGKFLPPGSLLGVPVNADVARKLDDVFFQPTFHQDAGVYEWIDKLIMLVQLLVGALPQTYGGSDPNVKTKGGQEQALKVAMGVLWLYWNQVRDEFARAANLSVDCFAANASDDEYHIAKSDNSPGFQNEPIRLADLSGKADARPEADQDYPIGYEQQRQLYKELFMMASGKEPNPLVMEVLDTFENRRQAMRYLGPPDMRLPETPFRDKILSDLSELTQPGMKPIPVAVPSQDPQTGMPTVQQILKPTIEPDPDFDNFDVLIDTVTGYVMDNYQELKNNPDGFENVRAYFKVGTQYKAERAAAQQGQALLTAGAPGWGGKLGEEKQGATAPTPGAQ